MSQPIWFPEHKNKTVIDSFRDFASERCGHGLADYFSLHRWSVDHPEVFWPLIAEFCGAVGHFDGRVLDAPDMFNAKWFPDTRINYAATMLKRRDDADAIVFRGEDKVQYRWSFAGLYARVSQIQQFLIAQGVVKGDCIAAFLPNIPEAIAAMLATASLGAIWSSASPDFGKQGVIDRFGQIEPKILFAVDGYFYNGKTHDVRGKIAGFMTDLPSVKRVVVCDYIGADDFGDIRDAIGFDEILDAYEPAEIKCTAVAFDHPLFILYSSGTTGVPKCIVHGHGGTLLQHLKEHQLHFNNGAGDRVFYFTTLSWMMWNWLVSALASGSTVMLYDGSPFYPGPEILWDFAAEENFTFFGTSAKYLEAAEKAEFKPRADRDLSSLRTLASTGSPLSAEGYEYVYNDIKSDLHLASVSGGTDIVSCFVLGVPTLPVYRGEIQAPGLGMAVEVWNEDAQPVYGERGELVCVKPFPSRPVMFWGDKDRAKYHAAYFQRFEADVWAHGDFAEITASGGMIIYGRSDAVLNPGGVRIGTAEIYRQVDKVVEVQESIVIGQEWDKDVRVVLFVKMREGIELNDEIRDQIKKIIRSECTPRHVPAKIIDVPDIPRTKSGKIVEIPVRDVVHNREVKNKEALANPQALEFYRNRAELKEE